MAPEQVKGRAADRRADIWAFGAVLYELWTGSMAFAGDSVTEILARVIEREPDWSKLPADTPPAIARLLHRSLVKDPKRRLQSIGDARLELDEASSAARRQLRLSSPSSGSRRWLIAGLALVVLRGSAVSRQDGGRVPLHGPRRRPPIRASIALPPGCSWMAAGRLSWRFLRDGRTIAFLARGATGFQRLYVRELGLGDCHARAGQRIRRGTILLAGRPVGRRSRWVSSDIGTCQPELRKYSLDTGLTQTISRLVDYFGGVWLDDGKIVFVNHQPAGLWVVDSAGGEARQLAAKWILDGQEVERAVAWPSLVPGTRSIVLS